MLKTFERPNDIDFLELQKELLNALRSKNSEVELTDHLEVSNGQLNRWRQAKNKIPWTKFIQILDFRGNNYISSFEILFRFQDNPANYSKLVKEIVGVHSLELVAPILKCSPLTLKRWMSAENEPSMIDVLKIIHICTDQLLDLLQSFVPEEKLVTLGEHFRLKKLERNLQVKNPWVALVPRCIELKEYEDLGRHQKGFISNKIGITLDQEEKAISSLLEIGVLGWNNEKIYVRSKYLSVDDPNSPANVFKILRFFLEEHTKMLNLQIHALEVGQLTRSDRSTSHRVFTTNQKTMLLLQKTMRDFNRKINTILSQDCNRGEHDAVCSLVVSLNDHLKTQNLKNVSK